MRVGLDISPLKTGHQFRGIGIYTQNLLQTFKKTKISGFYSELIEKGEISKDLDLIHYPFFDLFFLTLPFNKVKPTVVTIHDVIPLVFPEAFPLGIRGRLKFEAQKLSLKGVKGVITDSENSKKDISDFLNFPKEKIYVVPLAPGEEFKKINDKSLLAKTKKKYDLPDNFVLYVGDVNYNKNIPGLIKAFVDIKDQNLKLVLVGKAFMDKEIKETQEIFKLVKSLGLEKKVIFLGWVSSEELVAIYNQATVYCQPSFYEGFGLPVLEAMACGCPVVCADNSSLREICGQAALMVKTDTIYSIAKGISLLLDNRAKREELSKKGLEWVKNFSWQKTAQKTYEVYKKLV
jgi:glycosyltransferase involved in cell wall biosynthesis